MSQAPDTTERRLEWSQGLREAREARDLTQQDLAVALDMSVSTIAKWEAGRLPDLEAYLVVRAFFGHGFFEVEGARTRVSLDGIPASLTA